MTEWHCFKDKVKMIDSDLMISYMELTQRVPGIRCPQCGVGYLTEEIATTTVQEGEIMIEQK
jgi:DNA-directed RNA polymerase subunit RPC12/RpoP